MRGILMVFVIKNEHYGVKSSLSPLLVIMNIFLTLLKTGLEKENIELHAYYLMPNHFHLLICYEASITLVSLYNG
jgi:REP element-mobilizing transposase RayT